MKTRKVVTVAAFGVVALGAVMLARSPGVAPAASPAQATWTQGAQPVAPGTPVRAACRFEAGQRLSYAAALKTRTQQTTPGLNLPTSVELDLQGQLELQVLSVQPDAAVLAGRISLRNQPGTQPIDAEGFKAPFLVAVDGQCQLQRFARWAHADVSSARNQQALLWETTFRLGANELHVEDTSGVAYARLRPTEVGVHRTLVRYESTWPGEPAGLKIEGALGVELGAGPWFGALESRRQLSAEHSSTTSTWMLRRQDAAVSLAPPERVEQNYVWGDLLPRQPKLELAARPFTRFDRERQARVSGQSIDQALDAFTQRVQQGGGTQSKWPDLSAYFEAHPDALKPAYARYLKGELPANAAGDFFLALGKTRNDEARELLLAIKRDGGAVMMDQVRSMFALVTRTDVDVGLARELAVDVGRHVARHNHDSDFLAGESMLALSMMSGLRSDASIAQTSQQALESVLTQEPPDSRAAQLALRAVGNTGDPALLSAVASFTQSGNIDTRKAAAHVFSRMPRDLADPLEVEWLKRETNPFVKKELYRVFQQQHFDLQQGASRALVEQTLAELPTTQSAYTRKSMVFLIAQSAVGNEPDIRRALVDQAKKERARGTAVLNQFGTILTREERLEVLR